MPKYRIPTYSSACVMPIEIWNAQTKRGCCNLHYQSVEPGRFAPRTSKSLGVWFDPAGATNDRASTALGLSALISLPLAFGMLKRPKTSTCRRMNQYSTCNTFLGRRSWVSLEQMEITQGCERAPCARMPCIAYIRLTPRRCSHFPPTPCSTFNPLL